MPERDQEKTEQKSHKKWEEARDRGELPRSPEIATLAVFAVLLLYFWMTGARALGALGPIAADFLAFDRHLGLTAAGLRDLLLHPVLRAAALLAPCFLMILFLGALANMGQTGFHLASKKLQVDWGRLDPVRGLRRLFSLRSWVEGLKSILKISLFAAIVALTLKGEILAIVELPGRDLASQLAYLVDLSLKIGLRILVLMAALSVGDYLFHWSQFQERLKMTPREVKEEAKETEGDPLVRQRLRSLRLRMARERMLTSVKKSDVVVTNPTRYAVALAYDRSRAPAPFVSAKGAKLIADRIRELAREHGVPIVENPPLARALYRHVKVGRMIPSEFYRAIAELLAFVYTLKRRGARAPMRAPLRPRLKAALPPALVPPPDAAGPLPPGP